MKRRVLATFLGADGRLSAMPRRRATRLIVLDHIAQSFEPGRTYPESDVDLILARFH